MPPHRPAPEHGAEMWPRQFSTLSSQQQVQTALSICRQSPSLQARPFAHEQCNVEQLLERVMKKPADGGDDEETEFCWALSFSAPFVARLAYAGFLPMVRVRPRPPAPREASSAALLVFV